MSPSTISRPEKAEIDDLRRRTGPGADSGDPVRTCGSPPAAGVVPQVDADASRVGVSGAVRGHIPPAPCVIPTLGSWTYHNPKGGKMRAVPPVTATVTRGGLGRDADLLAVRRRPKPTGVGGCIPCFRDALGAGGSPLFHRQKPLVNLVEGMSPSERRMLIDRARARAGLKSASHVDREAEVDQTGTCTARAPGSLAIRTDCPR